MVKSVVRQVVELLSACPLLVLLYNMAVAGVRVVEFGTYRVIKRIEKHGVPITGTSPQAHTD